MSFHSRSAISRKQLLALSLAPWLPLACSGGETFGASNLLAYDTAATVSLSDVVVHSDATDYRNVLSATPTKTDTLLINVPQSLTVINEAQLRDQQMTSMSDVVRYSPGVSAHQGENNRDQIIFRGNSSSADFFVNGVRDDVQYFRDVYSLESVEILRGPNAMIFGRGGGGGVINRVTKEAGFSNFERFSVTAGSFENFRTTLDANRKLSTAWAGRLNAVFEHSGSFRDHVSLQREGIQPNLTFLPSQFTKITVGYEYLNDHRTADRGITSWQGLPAPLPIETYFGNADDSHVDATAHLFSALIEHRTLGGLEIKNRTLVGAYDRGYQNYVPGAVNAAKTLVTLTAYNNATERLNLFNQTDVTTHATTAGLQHTILAGVELGRQRSDNFRNTGYFNGTSTSTQVAYDHPELVTPATFRQSATDADNRVTALVAAAYAQDQIELSSRWQAIVGLRFDSFTLDYVNHRTQDNLRRSDPLLSPRAGLLYKPTATSTLYGSYSVSYLPSSGDQFSSLTTITEQVRPEKFTNYEVGAKVDLNRRLSFTTALYQLDRTNTRATDPNDATRIIQTGSQRSQGFEAGLTGTLASFWTVSSGYAIQSARIQSATTSAKAGARVAQVPRYSASLWNKFRLNSKLGLGVGIVRRSSVYAAVDNTVTLPGYTRVDAAAFYDLNANWHFQVNVENVFNTTYYANADNNTNISPGAPLTVRARVSLNF